MSCKQCLRLVLSITLLQRSVLLEIDRDQVSAERVPQAGMVYAIGHLLNQQDSRSVRRVLFYRSLDRVRNWICTEEVEH